MSDADVKQILREALAEHRAGKLSEAEMLYQKALVVQPNCADALHMLGVLTGQRGDADGAIHLIRRAIAIKPNMAEMHGNLGNFFREKRDFEGAESEYRRAIELKPTLADAHNNLGTVLRAKQQYDAAIGEYQRAVDLRPEYAEAHYNLGNAYHAVRRWPDSMKEYQAALRIRPDYAEAHVNLAYHFLALCDYKNGWEEYEWRWRVPSLFGKRSFDRPQWNGDDLKGRTIVLHAEQGFGDALQFVRYASMVAERGGRVVLECQKELVRLFENCAGVARVIAQRESPGEYDLHCPLLSLPRIFGTETASIPQNVPYVKPHDLDVKKWSARFNLDGLRRIGLVWAGQINNILYHHRSIPLAQFAPLATIRKSHFFSLQKEEAAGQTPPKNMKLTDWAADLADFAQTAALIGNLDLIITIDTAVAHLAGAMGKPVWIILPFDADWRWMLDRADSPWYPTARLFRQTAPGDWSAPIVEIARELGQS